MLALPALAGVGRHAAGEALRRVRNEFKIPSGRQGGFPNTRIPVKQTTQTIQAAHSDSISEISPPKGKRAKDLTDIEILNDVIDHGRDVLPTVLDPSKIMKEIRETVIIRNKLNIDAAPNVVETEYELVMPEIFNKTGLATTPEAIELLGPHEHWQPALLECMQQEDILIKGTRRTGKSLLLGFGSVLKLWRLRKKYPNGKICILSGKQEQATRPLNTMFENKEIREAIMPIFDHRTRYTLFLKGGMSIECIPPTDKNTRGGEIIGLVNDELAINKKLAIAQILPAGDTIDEFSWWAAGTPEAGGFFHDAWRHPDMFHMKKFDIKDDMCNWINTTNRGKTADRLKALVGEQFVLQELHGEFVQGDLIFGGQEIEDAFKTPKTMWPEQFDRVIAGLDVGWGNPATGELIGHALGQWWEIDHFSFRGDSDWPLTTAKLIEWGNKYPQVHVYCPTDNGGHSLIKRCHDRKIAVTSSDWGSLNKTDKSGRDYTNTSKSIPIAGLKELFLGDKEYDDKGEIVKGDTFIHLFNHELETQLYNYKADKKDDDRVDALLQAVWHSAGQNITVGHG